MRLVLLLLVLLLSACGAESSDAPVTDAGPSSEPVATTAPTSEADCLIGTWQIDPSSMDVNKVQGVQDIPDADFSVGESSGRALIAFEANGDAMQTFEDFSVTVNANVMGLAMSVRNDYTGTAAGTYAVENDRIVMQPGEANLSASVSINGGAAKPNPFATESVFEQSERGRTAFTCSGDELMLNIHAPESDGGAEVIRDVRYTRVAG
jgi:hypothetical protein